MERFKSYMLEAKGDKSAVVTSDLGDLYDLGSELGKDGKEGKDWDYDDARIDKDSYEIKILDPKYAANIEKIAKKLKIKVKFLTSMK